MTSTVTVLMLTALSVTTMPQSGQAPRKLEEPFKVFVFTSPPTPDAQEYADRAVKNRPGSNQEAQ